MARSTSTGRRRRIRHNYVRHMRTSPNGSHSRQRRHPIQRNRSTNRSASRQGIRSRRRSINSRRQHGRTPSSIQLLLGRRQTKHSIMRQRHTSRCHHNTQAQGTRNRRQRRYATNQDTSYNFQYNRTTRIALTGHTFNPNSTLLNRMHSNTHRNHTNAQRRTRSRPRRTTASIRRRR